MTDRCVDLFGTLWYLMSFRKPRPLLHQSSCLKFLSWGMFKVFYCIYLHKTLTTGKCNEKRVKMAERRRGGRMRTERGQKWQNPHKWFNTSWRSCDRHFITFSFIFIKSYSTFTPYTSLITLNLNVNKYNEKTIPLHCHRPVGTC